MSFQCLLESSTSEFNVKGFYSFLYIALPLILLVIVIAIISHFIKSKSKIKKHFYEWVFNKYGEKQILTLHNATPSAQSFNGFCRYNSIDMKYQKNGVEYICKTITTFTLLETPELEWIKKQKKGIEGIVYKNFAIFTIPDIEVSGINLAEAYKGMPMHSKINFVDPINNELKEEYKEYKTTDEYKKLKIKYFKNK
ncbi:MAG: hypothetical protein E7359_00070 [Clostridiales bacterium]|nr:hypothetical protein [Clostridiales bacterium]